jgi:hypothetical protein
MLSTFIRFVLASIALALGVVALIAIPMTLLQRVLCVVLAVVPVALYPASVWGVLIFTCAIVDFTLRTGWQFVSEWDVIVLLALGTGLLRTLPIKPARIAPRLVSWLFVALCVIFIVAMLRTWLPAPAWNANSINNVLSPWLAVHHGKPYVYALLAMPLIARTVGKSGRRLGWSVVAGSWCAMFALSLGALWERYAYTGFLNFASDYRITLGISSMHTGSGAIDAFIALAFPISMGILFDRRAWLQLLGLVSFPLFAYTAFVTFSRGLQLGIVVGAATAAVLYALTRTRGVRRSHRSSRSSRSSEGEADAPKPKRSLAVFILFLVGCVAALLSMFPTSGYRGALALTSCAFAMYLAFARSAEAQERGQRSAALRGEIVSIIVGVALALVVGFASMQFTKLPYLAHVALGAVSVFAASWVLFSGPQASAALRLIAQVCAVALLGTTVAVATYWGGSKALATAVGACVALVIGLVATRGRDTAWQVTRENSMAMGLGLVCAAGVAVALNASFFKERTTSSVVDLQGRAAHWRTTIGIGSESLTSALLGNGAGQFFTRYAMSSNTRDKPASFWLLQDEGGATLRLVSGKYQSGFGELIRFTQRLDVPAQQRFTVVLNVVPSTKPVVVEVGVCEKVLLFNAGCGGARVEIPAAQFVNPQILEVKMQLSEMPVFSPTVWRPLIVSFGLETAAAQLDARSIQILDDLGRNVLRNGDFDDGMNHWFHTTEAYHIPWHAHNWALAAWFDAGLLGLGMWIFYLVAMVVATGTGLRGAATSGHRLRAATMIGGIAGAMAVGAVDSLIDIPRVTFWLLLLCMCALAMALSSKKSTRVSKNLT